MLLISRGPLKLPFPIRVAQFVTVCLGNNEKTPLKPLLLTLSRSVLASASFYEWLPFNPVRNLWSLRDLQL